ncbi:SDR family oxidoreductase [Limibacillus sp. MBR-115]|jgi:NAD(P)-dependent dehydrogenase (short-subunit alcohol dehydrogenase family)|uniref:SDR family oxidoreductase n=1 Tax=Limibacillus sp. MBR-115 TaxID=3156465 RepID=UPI00339298A8
MYKDDLLAGKKVLVTGGGTGLGRSMAEHFRRLGAAVVICGRRQDVLAQTCEEVNARDDAPEMTWKGCDIRDAQAVHDMVEAIWSDGPLDVLVNNAAGNFISRSHELSSRAVDAVLGIVLHGTSYVTLACGKRWLAGEHAGNVLSIVTSYAWTGSAYVLPSAMAKAGVLAMTRSLAVEWGPHGVRLNAIAPGPFPTKGAWERLVPRPELAERFEQKNPLRRAGRHEELTNLACYLISDQSGYVNGEVVTIDGGEWLQGAGQFNFLSEMTDGDWEAIKPKKK